MATPPVLHRAATVEKIPVEKLSNLAYWERLDHNEQEHLSQTVRELSAELVGQWKSILRAGKLVNDLYEQTNPHGAFLRTLKALWGDFFSASSAYRYRNVYLAVRDSLSEQVVDVAVAHGIQLVSSNPEKPFGDYTEIVEKLPPPKPGVRGAEEWVEKFKKAKQKVEDRGPSLVIHPADVKETEKQMYLMLRNNFRRLPMNPKTRRAFVENIAGYLLRMAGMQSAIRIEPATPPREWEEIRRGRPKKEKEAA